MNHLIPSSFPCAKQAKLGTLIKTPHFVERQRARGIPDAWVIWALLFGVRFYEGSECVYFLGRKHLNRLQQVSGVRLSEREQQGADGIVVVVSEANALITTYRNPVYCRTLRRRCHRA